MPLASLAIKCFSSQLLSITRLLLFSNLFLDLQFFDVFILISGFMTENEKKLFEAVPANEFNTYWVPCTWFIFRLQEAAKHGKLLNQYALESIMRVSGEDVVS